MNNFAFIDAQNVYLTLKDQGWKVDWGKLRTYLSEKYKVDKAYFFIGYLADNAGFYRLLKSFNYELIFKEVIEIEGKIKGNVDAELVLQAMIDYKAYDKAILLTNDGDFTCLVKYLKKQDKLLTILSPNHKTCSVLLKKAFKNRIPSLGDNKDKLAYKK